MTMNNLSKIEKEKENILLLIENLKYGEIIIKKEGGKIVQIKRTESIKID